jgi:HAD superfamily hydrolase (TIGR01509 family)
MIKGIVFDMDGVLIDARDWHYQALNDALEIFGFAISEREHASRFDGLPTKEKLNILSSEQGLPKELHQIINEIKQERTLRIAASICHPIPNVISAVSNLSNLRYKLGVATNSIRETTMVMLDQSQLTKYFDAIVTNSDVKFAKPNPEIYLKACELLKLPPGNVLVVEDNRNGIIAASEAGCVVHKVADPFDVHLDEILSYL